jgi:2'-hydroxyisoflavone reductase
MRLLILGGTRFLGRHTVEAALARGHEVTLFTRGRTPQPFGDRVRALAGDRDPRIAPGLAALDAGVWDAVIDTSGYVPRVVGASAALVAPRVRRYVFVSSLSVLAKADRPGLDESAPVATLDDPATEDVLPNYGGLKAACEAVVNETLGGRATIVRPGLIVGPHDVTDRFGYWVARFVHPRLLGDRLPRAVVPAPRERPVQFIDARDLAAFLLDLCERDVGGTFNACSPAGQWTMGDLVDACVAAASDPPASAWVDERTLADFHVEPWVGLPLWIPSEDPDAAGFMSVSCGRAAAAGLRTRELEDTVRDTADWLAARDNSGAWKHVISDARERLLLSAIDSR